VNESKEDIVAGLESGADDYLVKPFDPDELKARLRTGERILHFEDRLVEAREEMRFRATHDHLTSLWNRGVIMDLLGRELARSQRENGNCPPGPALEPGEEIRKAIGARPIQMDAGALKITMSLGRLLSSDGGHRPADELLREVDAAPYAAKSAGRNCVRVAKPEESLLAVRGPQPASERLR
jgi:PleD family two-component response regulator